MRPQGGLGAARDPSLADEKQVLWLRGEVKTHTCQIPWRENFSGSYSAPLSVGPPT